MCGIMKRLPHGGGGDGSIVFSLAPHNLDFTGYSDTFAYSENDIYYLEVCTLNEMCSNRNDLFGARVGDRFWCQFDKQAWLRFGREVMELG